MAWYVLDPKLPIDQEIRRIVVEPLEQARSTLANGVGVDAVHQARKLCKRARAATALAGDAVGHGRRLDRTIRDASRPLSIVRDTDVMRGWVAERSLQVRIDEVPDRVERGKAAVAGLGAALGLATSLSYAAVDLDVVLRAIGDSWKRTRSAYREAAATPTGETLHTWRKRAKRLMYQLEMLGGHHPEVVPVAAMLDGLQEALGEHHDLAVLSEYAPTPELPVRAAALERHALAWGAWLFRARGDRFSGWIAARPS